MDEIIDVVVPVAMLLISLATAVLGAKKKKEQHRVDRPDDTPDLPYAPENVSLRDVVPVVDEGISSIPDKKPVVNEAFEPRPEKEKHVMTSEEKKKLIIYSEILKPKFDS